MKNKNLIAFSFVFVLIISFIVSTSMIAPQAEETPKAKIFPEEIEKVFANSCYDCHTAGARSEKALMKLNFSTWDELKASKKLHKMDEIVEEIVEESMPPEKYLNRFPDKALTKEQVKLVKKWAKTESDKILAD